MMTNKGVIETQLVAILDELDDKDAERDELGGEIATLEMERDELEDELAELAMRANERPVRVWGQVLARTVGWFDFVRDPHEKIWYNGGNYQTVILADYKIYGCNDLVPNDDSEVVYIGRMDTWGGMA